MGGPAKGTGAREKENAQNRKFSCIIKTRPLPTIACLC